MVQMPVLTPETFGDLHLISVLIEGEIGSVISVERRIGYKDISFVRGGEAIPMTEQSTFLADYEAGQNVPVEYRATAGLDGETVTSDWVLADNLDSGDDFFFTLENPFLGMKLHVMVRFGMWQEILAEEFQKDAELFSFSTALLRYGRVIALANTGQHDAATAEYDAFLKAKEAVQETRYMFNNPAEDVLGIAQQMAVGERLYKSGDYEAGLDHLRAAANYSDNLHYDEPWGWMQPPRHALAALLMEQKQYVEAEEIYRADLGLNDTLARPCQHPKNIWSLHGLSECLNKRGETQELVHVQLLLDQALARAEVPVSASCYCRNT